MKNEDILHLEAFSKNSPKIKTEVKSMLEEMYPGAFEVHLNFTDDFLQPMDLALFST